MPNRTLFSASLLACAIAAITAEPAIAQIANAQVADSTSSSAQAQHSINLPAGSLSTSLNALARLFGITLAADPALVNNLQAPAVTGNYSARQALDAVLAKTGLSAQPAADGSFSIVVLPKSVGVLKTVKVEALAYREDRVLGASKTEESLLDAPQNVQIFTRERVADQGLKSVDEVALTSASISYADGGRVVIRGFEQNPDHDDYLRVDGQKGRLSTYTQAVTMVNVERVEILKGANGVLYGAGVEGGAINLITKKPQAETRRVVSAEAGSYSHSNINADMTGAVNESKSLRYRFVAEGIKDGMQFDQSNRSDIYIAPSAEWVGAATTALFQFEHRDSEQTPSYWGASGVFPNGDYDRQFAEKSFHSSGDYDKNKGNAYSARVNHFLESGQELVGNLRYSKFREQYRSHFATGLAGDGRMLERDIYDSDNHINSLSSSFYSTYTLDTQVAGQHKLLAGVDLERYEGKQSSFWGWWDGTTPSIDIFEPDYSLAAPLPPEEDRLAFDYSYKTDRVYLQDKVSMGERWSAVVGLTYEASDQRETDGQTYTGEYDYSKLTKRVGVVYKPVASHALFATYTEGFKPVPIWKNQPDSGGPFDPQDLEQREVGYQWESNDKRLGLVASIYSIEKTNIPYRLPGAGRDEPFYANTVESKGFEVDLTGQLTSQWFVQAGYAYHDGKITESVNPELVGLRQYNTNRHKLSLWTRYNFANIEGLGIGTGVIHTADPVGWGGPAQDYTLVDMGAYYSLSRHWSFSLKIRNATDELYVPFAGTESTGLPYGKLRSYYLTGTYTF